MKSGKNGGVYDEARERGDYVALRDI